MEGFHRWTIVLAVLQWITHGSLQGFIYTKRLSLRLINFSLWKNRECFSEKKSVSLRL